MELDDITEGIDIAEETPRVSKRQLAQQAIALAMQSRWQEAAEVNQQIVELDSSDAEAYNRLGKAQTELGRIVDARAAYENALRCDAANLIAQRNLDRLSRISDAEAADLAKRAGSKLDPRFFMEETGKTGITALQEAPGPEELAKLTAGDEVRLEPRDGRLVVLTVDEMKVGMVEDKLATRLVRLMQTGNQYRAGIVGVDGREVRIIIRETFQAPQNSGRISFPPRVASETLPRPYLREGLVRRTAEDDDDEDLELDLREGELDEEEEDAGEFGFHESSLDEA
ncbi:MAG TPA: hypothetical protein VKX16_01580 [Chloroflexota bacterium]|nr:hypothetical protein [Chloroflexota bacterium]